MLTFDPPTIAPTIPLGTISTDGTQSCRHCHHASSAAFPLSLHLENLGGTNLEPAWACVKARFCYLRRERARLQWRITQIDQALTEEKVNHWWCSEGAQE